MRNVLAHCSVHLQIIVTTDIHKTHHHTQKHVPLSVSETQVQQNAKHMQNYEHISEHMEQGTGEDFEQAARQMRPGWDNNPNC
jgi:uncharacterized protein (UPF0548 family)